MEVSIFLAKTLGLYLLVIAILAMLRQDIFYRSARSIISNPDLVLVIGSIDLFAGLAVLIGHPVWGFEWPCVISLLGLLLTVRAVVRIAMPEVAVKVADSILQNKNSATALLLITALLGLFLTVHGFSH